MKLGKTGKFPDGKLSEHDEGELVLGVSPLANLWDVGRGYFDTRTPEQKRPGPNYVPLGGAGNGA